MSKNRVKKRNLSPAMFVLLVMTAISLATTGIFHAVMKNRQLQVVRQIDQVERRIKDQDRDIIYLEIKIDQLENHRELRESLTSSGTSLQPIPLESIVAISPAIALPELASTR